jgi:hypothetical protein
MNATDHWRASCRHCGEEILRTSRVGDHDVLLLRRHLHGCRPHLCGEFCGAMSVVRRHFHIEAV